MDINLLEEKMKDSISFLEKELSSLRTARANPSILDNIYVDAYGAKTPINQIGNISIPDSSTVTIQVWDTNLLKNVENSIIESKLGINPQTDGNLIRLPIPKLSEERRIEISKIASQFGENAKISIRNNRREFLDEIKKSEKEKEMSQDDSKKLSNEVQNITDNHISQIDQIVSIKQKEVTKV